MIRKEKGEWRARGKREWWVPWGHLHALEGGNAVECVLVAATAPAQHRLGPPAQLYTAVRPDQLVAYNYRLDFRDR